MSLQTSDIRDAQERRDELEREVAKAFADIKAGRVVSQRQMDAKERGAMWRDAIRQAAEEGSGDADDISIADIAMDLAREEGERLSDKEQREFNNSFAGRVNVEEHLEAYLSAAKLAPKTTNERRGLVLRFARWCAAEGLRLPAVNRRTAGNYVSAKVEPMHPRTAKKHVTALRGYFDYLRRRGLVGFNEQRDNPWNDQIQPNRARKAIAGQDEQERPFTDAEVLSLLGPASEEGTFDKQVVEVLTIGLLSGMREGEIARLRVRDIVDGGDGHGLIFDVKDAKTGAGLRRVPVHSHLEPIIRILTEGKDAGDWLYTEFADMPDPGDTFGKRFRRYREVRGVDDKREGRRRSLVNFHSARRWLVTQAHRAGFAEDIVAAIVGHEYEGRKKKITFSVYSGGPSGKQKRECVEAVKLPVEGQ